MYVLTKNLVYSFSRFCDKDYTYKDITIPKGSVVTIPVILLHKDPEYWNDPDEFDPMRYIVISDYHLKVVHLHTYSFSHYGCDCVITKP